MDLFEGFGKIKYYMMVIGALFVWFLWGSITGTKIIGDDNEVREERNGQQHFGSFNHK